MKIIDRTPFYNEKGEISFADRTRAILKYGKSWLEEMEAQKSVLPIFEKNLDRKYTLLRNVALPGLDAPIPFILVGPAGIYVCTVTNKTGMFRAKGDQWGTVSGVTFKPEKINPVTRTEQFARAVQLYLKDQIKLDIPGVETALLCTNPSIHVDIIRPIVRVVMRDALERFIISISETTPVISQEMVIKVVDAITNPCSRQTPERLPNLEGVPGAVENEIPASSTEIPGLTQPLESNPAEVSQVPPAEDQARLDDTTPVADPLFPPLPQEASHSIGQDPTMPVENINPYSSKWPEPASLAQEINPQPGMIPLQSELPPEPYSDPLPESLFPGLAQKPAIPEPVQSPPIKRKPISGKQWLILAGLALIWIILVGILLFFILKDLIL